MSTRKEIIKYRNINEFLFVLQEYDKNSNYK
jgi:hypothetical protein